MVLGNFHVGRGENRVKTLKDVRSRATLIGDDRSLEDVDVFKIGRQKIASVRYTEDTVILAESELQAMMNVMVSESEKRGLSPIHHEILLLLPLCIWEL